MHGSLFELNSEAFTHIQGHLLVSHSEICTQSFLNGHLGKSDTASRQFSRSYFQHACGMADHKITALCLFVCLFSARAERGPQHMQDFKKYYLLSLCPGLVPDSSCKSLGVALQSGNNPVVKYEAVNSKQHFLFVCIQGEPSASPRLLLSQNTKLTSVHS